MEEILENNSDIPEKITPQQHAEETKETSEDSKPVSQEPIELDEEPPAEMSLEGRKIQLEKKVSEQQNEPAQPAQSQTMNIPPSAPRMDIPYQYGAGQAAYMQMPQKPKRPPMQQGAKAYIILISGLTAVFVLGFIIECARRYNESGLFGGDLDRFVDGDYSAIDPFGSGGGEDSDNSAFGGFGGLFPFNFDDSDEDIGDASSDDNVSESDSDKKSSSGNLIDAPDAQGVLNPEAAVLKGEDQPDDIDTASYTARNAYKKVEKSVVNVVVYSDPESVGKENSKLGTGSGIIVSKDGYIITNSHVIEDSSESGVEVITGDGTHYKAAIVGFDTRTDLAVIKISANDLTPVEFVNSDQIEVGQDAYAVGNPGGITYSNSFTRGCVSALNRTVPSNTQVGYIQTDAAINPGNSGGPLLNSAGQVMGITTIKIANTDYEGMGFAIPSNTVIETANSMISKGYVEGRVKLGILARVYQTPYITGIEILEINDDSVFLKTDAKVGDVITAIDDQEITDFTTLYRTMGQYQPGDVVDITLVRPSTGETDNQEINVRVTFIADEGAVG